MCPTLDAGFSFGAKRGPAVREGSSSSLQAGIRSAQLESRRHRRRRAPREQTCTGSACALCVCSHVLGASRHLAVVFPPPLGKTCDFAFLFLRVSVAHPTGAAAGPSSWSSLVGAWPTCPQQPWSHVGLGFRGLGPRTRRPISREIAGRLSLPDSAPSARRIGHAPGLWPNLLRSVLQERGAP